MMTETVPESRICPECGSESIFRNGFRQFPNGMKIQRFLCRNCFHRFSERPIPSKRADDKTRTTQVCAALARGTKNLSATETGTVVGDTRGALTLFSAKRLNKGKAEETVTNQMNMLHRLQRLGANLFDPTNVWHTIDKAKKNNGEELSNGSKRIAAQAYVQFCNANSFTIPEDVNFNKWRKTTDKLPFIPTAEEIANLIGGFKAEDVAYLTLLKETGFRSGEAWKLKWTDIDFEKCVATMNVPEKGSLPRQQKISADLCAKLNNLPKTKATIWGGDRKSLYYFRIKYCHRRANIATSQTNPRIKQIKLHTFRHYYASMLYHKTKDLVHVQERLGHKSILNTRTYTHLVNFSEDEYNSTIAKTQAEKLKLLSEGWDFVVQDSSDGLMYFRRRK